MIPSPMPHCEAAPVQRHRPAILLSVAATGLVNRLVRPRAPFMSEVEGLALRLEPGAVLLKPAPPIADAVELGLAVGHGRLALRLPAAAVRRLACAVQPDLTTWPAGPAGPMLIELALAPLLDAAERITGTAITIGGIGRAPEPPPGRLTLIVAGVLGGMSFPAQLDLGPSATADATPLGSLLALVEAAPARPAQVVDLPLAVRFVAGQTRLTLRQIDSLEPGDAVLPDVWFPAQGETRAELGNNLVAMARTDRHTSTLRMPFRPTPEGPAAARWVTSMAQDQSDEDRDAGQGIDAIGVDLCFELGRCTLALSELKAVGEGHVFDLGLDPQNPVDLIVNGARIGRGEIVEIGERIGVRVVRLFGRD